MSVLTTLTALPNRFLIALEYIESYGEKGLDRQLIYDRLQIEDDSIVDGNIKEMTRLELIKLAPDNKIIINYNEFNLSGKNSNPCEALYPVLLKKLTHSEEAEISKQSEVPLNIAWLLSMNPYQPLNWSGTVFKERRNMQLTGNNELLNLITNDQRLQNLAYWSRYLGFSNVTKKIDTGEKSITQIIPDPTEVIHKNIPKIFNKNTLTIEEFLDRLGKIIPVMEGGGVRNYLESKMKSKYQRVDGHFSKSTSLALKRLEMRKTIKFEQVSDTTTMVLDLGQETQQITHIQNLTE